MNSVLLVLYCIVWVVVLHRFNLLLGGRSFKQNPQKAALYIAVLAASGVLTEVYGDTIYNALFGHPLWLYHLFPLHSGYTSVFSLYLWGITGFHLYMQKSILKKWRITSSSAIAFIFCLDAIVLEVLTNGSYKLIFKDYIFYYLPGDLWHLTSLQVVLPYFLVGVLIHTNLTLVRRRQKTFLVGNVALALLAVGSSLLFR